MYDFPPGGKWIIGPNPLNKDFSSPPHWNEFVKAYERNSEK